MYLLNILKNKYILKYGTNLVFCKQEQYYMVILPEHISKNKTRVTSPQAMSNFHLNFAIFVLSTLLCHKSRYIQYLDISLPVYKV